VATDPQVNFQTAIYTTTVNAAAIQTLVGTRVYDHVPQETEFDYITIGEITAVDFSTKSFDGQESTVTFHAWSRYAGRKKAKQITGALYTLFHNNPVTVSGHNHFQMQFDFEDTFLDPDGLTYHGVIRFRSLIHE
jgi:hypothetical protein